jgi:hypothetical protein
MSVDKHARIPQSTSNRALTSLRKSALDLLSFAIKRQDWSANCCMIYAPGQGARCSWIQILSKNNKIIAKSDMDSFGTSFLRTTPPQQVPLNKSPSTSPPQQVHRNKSSTTIPPTGPKQPAAFSSSDVSTSAQRWRRDQPPLTRSTCRQQRERPREPAYAAPPTRPAPDSDVLMYYSRKCSFALPCRQPRSRQNQSQHPAPSAASTLKACCRL